MTQPGIRPSHSQLSGLALESVSLSVASLDRSLGYYGQTLGLRTLERSEGRALLGADTPLLELLERPGVQPSHPADTGLYHLALLLPSRADLGRLVGHLVREQVPVQGTSDHLVSEAIYLQDPDGHGLEVYADRPAQDWRWQEGEVSMDTRPADLQGILAAAASDPGWRGLPDGTRLGHVHLRVSDLERARAFYSGVLGLDVVVDLSAHGALFVSADRYHHHFGLNIWQSRGGRPAPEGRARLEAVRLSLPAAGMQALRDRLRAAGTAFHEENGVLGVGDPDRNRLELRAAQG